MITNCFCGRVLHMPRRLLAHRYYAVAISESRSPVPLGLQVGDTGKELLSVKAGEELNTSTIVFVGTTQHLLVCKGWRFGLSDLGVSRPRNKSVIFRSVSGGCLSQFRNISSCSNLDEAKNSSRLESGPSKSPKMAQNLNFTSGLAKADPLKTPVTIIGQLDDLRKLTYDDIKIKLEPRVPVDVYHYAVESLQPSPTDSCSLFMNHSTIVSLPLKISRNNTNSRAHYLTKAVKNASNNMDEYIVIVCEKKDVFASGCAVARAFPTYIRKSKKEGKDDRCTTTVEFLLVTRNGDDVQIGKESLSDDDLSTLQIAGDAIRNAARITDTPCSEMHTNQFIKEAASIAEKLGVKMTVIQGEELADRGMGGIYNVGKAAENAPALVVLSHSPPGATQTIAWVGKGIVYDTGGLSIKGKTGMCTMKRDCGGAAGILNAYYLAVTQGFSQNLHAVLCLAENAVGPKSYRPDDILVMYSKKTVEINNTDAEGRLVLADGVVYAKQDLKADIIVDMATLTGAQGVSTGHYHAACLTNVEEWEALSVKAGKASGDLVHPIVFAPEFHFSEFNSVIADMKNSAADRSNALCSCAGLFILSHLGFDFPGTWLHIDMASPVESAGRATGYGVALLNVLFGKYSKSDMLKSLAPAIPSK